MFFTTARVKSIYATEKDKYCISLYVESKVQQTGEYNEQKSSNSIYMENKLVVTSCKREVGKGQLQIRGLKLQTIRYTMERNIRIHCKNMRNMVNI